MRKLLCLLAAIAVVAFAGADTGWAAVTGTAHQTSIGNQGACSACHIPHKSVGKRLWPSNMGSQEASFGEVGALCYYCHGSGGGKGTTDSIQPNVMNTAYPGGMYSHGLDPAQIPFGGNIVATSGLPYAGRPSLQCTSCHNVHDDTNRPFLQRPIDVLCTYCHSQRMMSTTAGTLATVPLSGGITAWGAAYYGLTNPGSHPVGSDVTGDNNGSASPITVSAVMAMAKNAAAGSWSLGGHLTGGTTGGVTCTTCHAPHGVDTDDANPPEDSPHVGLLVISQDPTSGTIADGRGGVRDALCEGCHVNGAAGIWNPAGAGAAYAGTREPNPGGTAYTHPVDDLGSKYTTVPDGGAFPGQGATWPVGSAPGTNMSPAVICESCHTPHPLADATPTPDTDYIIGAGSNRTLLRDSNANICGICHTQTIAGHHPVGAYGARFAAANIGDNASPLTCGDCHNGNGAHNWVGVGMVGMDPDWVPANNGRTATDSRAGDLAANTSSTCTTCHTNSGGHYSPTNNAVDGGAAPPTAPLSTRTRSAQYWDDGDGSHYLGDTVAVVYTNGYLNGAAWNATTQNWTGNTNGNTGWSRFDSSGTNHIVCESCHDVEPDKNSGTVYPMLLGEYREADNLDPSDFCEACHSTTPGGAQPHPMTGDSISRAMLAADAGGNLLLTTGRYTRALASWSGGATAPNATNSLNCDSCHQPHDASTPGGTYIYDSSLVTGTAGAGGGANGHPPRGSASSGLNDLPFCNQCHVY